MPSKIQFCENIPADKLLHHNKAKYKLQGKGLIVSILINVYFFGFFAEVLRRNWEYVLMVPGWFHGCFTAMFIHSAMFLLANSFCYYISKKKWKIFEDERISPNVLWPWEEKNPKIWDNMKKKSLYVLLHHHFFLTPLFSIADYFFMSGTCFRFESETLPSTFELIWQFAIFMLFDDFFFTIGHMILHIPWLYPKIHKLHHEHYNPVAFSAEYDHWFEYSLGLISTGLLPRLMGRRVHFMTMIMWIFLRSLELQEDHCGYEFSWSPFRLIPFSGSASYHNYHHTHNSGNYGTFFTFWDSFMGTNKPFYDHLDKLELDRLKESYKVKNE